MDRNRLRPAYLQNIFDVLNLFELPWDEGPAHSTGFDSYWSQLKRTHHYTQVLNELREKKLVFACNCTRSDLERSGMDSGCAGSCKEEQLSTDKPGSVWRLHTPDTDPAFPLSMKDFVVRKKDGQPSYQLCSVVDDHLFQVGYVVRGMDLLNSTLAQKYLSTLLENNSYKQTLHLHHPLLKHSNGEKFSKSSDAQSLYGLIQQGYSVKDILCSLATELGMNRTIYHWSEFKLEELIIRENQPA